MWKGRNGNSNRHTWCRLDRWFDVQMWYTLVRYLCASLLYIERWCFITTYGYFVVTCGAYLNCSVSFFSFRFFFFSSEQMRTERYHVCVRTASMNIFKRKTFIWPNVWESNVCASLLKQTDSGMTHKSSLQMDDGGGMKKKDEEISKHLNLWITKTKFFIWKRRKNAHTHTHLHSFLGLTK